MHNRLLLSRLAAVLIAAAVFVSGCDQYMTSNLQRDGAATEQSRQVTKAESRRVHGGHGRESPATLRRRGAGGHC